MPCLRSCFGEPCNRSVLYTWLYTPSSNTQCDTLNTPYPNPQCNTWEPGHITQSCMHDVISEGDPVMSGYKLNSSWQKSSPSVNRRKGHSRCNLVDSLYPEKDKTYFYLRYFQTVTELPWCLAMGPHQASTLLQFWLLSFHTHDS